MTLLFPRAFLVIVALALASRVSAQSNAPSKNAAPVVVAAAASRLVQDSTASPIPWRSTLIGAGVGALVGAAVGGLVIWTGGGQGCAGSCRPNDEVRYVYMGAAIGAGIGAGVGFAIGNRRLTLLARVPIDVRRR